MSHFITLKSSELSGRLAQWRLEKFIKRCHQHMFNTVLGLVKMHRVFEEDKIDVHE